LSKRAYGGLRRDETEAPRELDESGLRGPFNLLNTNLRERYWDAANRSVSDGAASEGETLLQDEPARQGGFESVCVVGLGSVGVSTAEYPWVAASCTQALSDGPTPRLTCERPGDPFGQPSKSAYSGPDSSKTSGIVCEPCHSVASLKYSFGALLGYGPRAAEIWRGIP
jgi:hypothetical protein